MKKGIIAIGIAALFIAVVSIPVVANPQNKDTGPGWEYLVIGRIRSYEIVDYNGTEYIECRAVRVSFYVWNISEDLKFPLRSRHRFGQKFNIPLEGAEIFGPNRLGRYFIIARGSL